MEGFDANTNLEPSFSYALPKTIYTDNKFLTQFSTAQNTASLIITTNKQLTPVIVSDLYRGKIFGAVNEKNQTHTTCQV